MEENRKKSVQEKVTELQTRIKMLNAESERRSSSIAASLKTSNELDKNHYNDDCSEGDVEFTSGDKIIKLNELDLSNEETWLYIPEKPTANELTMTAVEANEDI